MSELKLAILGGAPLRNEPMPGRNLFDQDVMDSVINFFKNMQESGFDYGSQQDLEEELCASFVNYLKCEGFADAVNSGSTALYIAIRALEITNECEFAVSCITDPGAVSAVIMNGHKLSLIDTKANSYNPGLEQVKQSITPKTKAVLLNHAAGFAIDDIQEIATFCKEKGLYLIEDCSQAAGAEVSGKKIGTFGDISIFSTMSRKNFSTGGNGGMIFTRSKVLYKKVRSYADRGKDFFSPDYNPKDPSQNLFPSLNFNTDELSSLIGIKTLSKLDTTRSKRIQISKELKLLSEQKLRGFIFSEFQLSDSPFFLPIDVQSDCFSCDKVQLAEAIKAEGIELNSDYKYLVSNWPWCREEITGNTSVVNASKFLANSFNLLYHEKYDKQEIQDIINSFHKVANHYSKRIKS